MPSDTLLGLLWAGGGMLLMAALLTAIALRRPAPAVPAPPPGNGELSEAARQLREQLGQQIDRVQAQANNLQTQVTGLQTQVTGLQAEAAALRRQVGELEQHDMAWQRRDLAWQRVYQALVALYNALAARLPPDAPPAPPPPDPPSDPAPVTTAMLLGSGAARKLAQADRDGLVRLLQGISREQLTAGLGDFASVVPRQASPRADVIALIEAAVAYGSPPYSRDPPMLTQLLNNAADALGDGSQGAAALHTWRTRCDWGYTPPN